LLLVGTRVGTRAPPRAIAVIIWQFLIVNISLTIAKIAKLTANQHICYSQKYNLSRLYDA